MATVSITVKTSEAAAANYTASGEAQRCLTNSAHLLTGLAIGCDTGEVSVSVSSDDPVAASGTLTLVSAIATDAVTIGKTTLTASSTPADENEWEIDGASDTLDAVSLAACINAHETLSLIVSATSALGVVTITAREKGILGNHIALSSADATITASATYLADGTGGVSGAQTVYTR